MSQFIMTRYAARHAVEDAALDLEAYFRDSLRRKVAATRHAVVGAITITHEDMVWAEPLEVGLIRPPRPGEEWTIRVYRVTAEGRPC